MKVIRKSGKNFVLRFEKGEDYPTVFAEFLRKGKIQGGFFSGLGAFAGPEIAYYDIKKKKYLKKKFRGVFEVLNLTGNVAASGREIFVHSHVTLGKRNYTVIGGHLTEAKIGGTLEVYFSETAPMKRAEDSKTGLNLLS